jgi:predicted ATPase/DNA-binding CsgD family transcriptional regulator
VAGAAVILDDPLVLNERSNSGSGAALAGAVTFLVADLDAERRPWEPAPAPSAETVAAHRSILDDTVARRSGTSWYEDGNGAGVIATFARAGDALAAAVEAQFALSDQNWPDGVDFRTRIALNTARGKSGDDGRHFAVGLSRCAQMRAIARGGQVLVSEATRELVLDCLPPGTALADLGSHRVGHGGERQRVYRLEHPGLPADAGPLRSLDALPNNLPDPLASFVGRGRELREVLETLWGARCVTLTGAGGSGKTRLALRAAVNVLERFPDGAWWVDLAPLEHPAMVEQAVAAALGLRVLAGRSPLEAVMAHLAARQALVLLDNCEHVVDGAARTAAAIVERCPQVTVLATSRESLGIEAETTWHVPTLSLPDPEAESGLLPDSDAVRLFVERARDARSDFQVADSDPGAIARICVELDGIPLAIELAAARTRMLSLDQIAAGLLDRFRLLAGSADAEHPRHKTLRASIDWSHELLSERTRAVFRRLSIFRGGFDLDAAEAVAAGCGVEQVAVLDLLALLIDQSLVVAEEHGATVRYRMLETVRQYAHDRLVEAGELEGVRDRHRDEFLALAERLDPGIVTGAQAKALALLDAEAANLSSALQWAAETDPERALRLCLALTRWWRLRGLFAAAERSYERALAAADPTPSALRARVLWGRAYLLTFAGEYQKAIECAQEALSIAQEVGDEVAMARALHVLGQIRIFPDPVGSRRGLERARELARAGGDDYFFVAATQVLAQSYQICDEYEEANRLFDEVLPLVEREGYRGLFAFRCLGMSVEALMRSDRDRLFEYAEQALVAAREVGEPVTEGIANVLMALFELAEGKVDAAAARLEQSRERITAKGAGMALHYTETAIAAARAESGDDHAARADLEAVIELGADFGYWLAWTIAQLADLLRAAGDSDGASDRAHAGLEIAERVQSPTVIAWCKEVLGRLAAMGGDWRPAESLLHEALELRLERRLWLWLPQTLDGLAEVAGGLESHEEAVRLLGAARAGRAALGLVRRRIDEPRLAALERTLREVLGEHDFEAAHAAGERLSLEEAAAWLRRARGSRKRPPGGWESLTPTELEVARHAAGGLTNPQIGERMFITRGTVKVHLSHIYGKLGVQNRAELAAEAARRMPVQSA